MPEKQASTSDHRRPAAVRNLEVGNLLDTFLVCAVGTIVVIRFQLWLTDYPQLGPGGLHIAHMLWGGLAMMLAIGILLAFSGRAWRLPAAILGGIGFGFFIDELGKFITADNDYFFQPTAAIIYVIFIALFLAARAVQRRRGFSPAEELAGATDLVKQAAWRRLDAHDRRRAIQLLERADDANPLTRPLREFLATLEAEPARAPGRAARLAAAVRRRYFELIRTSAFRTALTVLFLVLAILSLAHVGLLLFAGEIAARGGDASDILRFVGDEAGSLSVGEALHIGAGTVSGLFMIAGAYRLRRSRLRAYRLFDRGLLVQILVVQFFALLESEFSALFGLFFYLALFATLRYVMASEEDAAASGGPGYDEGRAAPPAPAVPAASAGR